MVDRPLRSTEIANFDPREQMLVAEEDKSRVPDSTSRKTTILKQVPRASLFCSIVREDLEGLEKSGSKRALKSQGDMLLLFPTVLASWEEMLPTLLQGKTNRKLLLKESFRPNVAGCYEKVCGIFAELLGRFAKEPGNEGYLQRTFADEFFQTAVLGIEHTHGLLVREVFCAANPEGELAGNQASISAHFATLKMFNEFFFVVAKLKCNVALPERPLLVLQRIVSDFYKLLQGHLHGRGPADLDRDQPKRKAAVATFTYHVLQTVAAMAIFGEAPALSKKKYAFILERFQTTFALVSSSRAAEALFTELYEFEEGWQTGDGVKHALSSFGQKRISVYVLPEKLRSIRLSLKYVALCYNYKILKIISQRTHLSCDERLLNALSPLVKRNKELLAMMLGTRDEEAAEPMRIMLLLNENVVIIKSYILSLAHFSSKLDRTRTQQKYALIKETAIDTLCLAIRAGLRATVRNRREIEDLSIFFPADLIALVFRALLQFRVKGNVSFKYEQETIGHVNSMIADMASMFVHTNDSPCTYMYRLYLLQFINAWDASELKEKYAKYAEEVSRILNDNENSREGDLVEQLKEKSFDVALNIYVKLSSIDCTLPMESTLRSIRESATNEKQLFKYFYILECLLCKSKLQSEDFERIQAGDAAFSADLLGHVTASRETDLLIDRNGIGTLLGIYRNATACYLQRVKARANSVVASSVPEPGPSPNLDVNKYIAQTVLKEMDTAIASYRKISEQTGAFVLALCMAAPVAHHCLSYPSLDHEFYETVLQTDYGCTFVLRLLETLETHLLGSQSTPGEESTIERYVAMLADMLLHLGENNMSLEREKGMLVEVSRLVQTLVRDKAVSALQLAHCIGKSSEGGGVQKGAAAAACGAVQKTAVCPRRRCLLCVPQPGTRRRQGQPELSGAGGLQGFDLPVRGVAFLRPARTGLCFIFTG